jgi:valyl-tRNA synthetase
MAYDPKLVEDKRYAEWLKQDLFHATPGEGEPYCITIPPPNITGSLHMGHALNNSIIDCMTRWHRMRGFNAITVPGTDHAGIGTQNVVEKDLAKEGLTRHDLGREKFIERCWEWRKQYGDRIYLQFHKLGCGYDWSRARFTMDETYVEAIYEEFLRWWDKGLIYRGARVVNWCPRCRSAISDIEVDSEERNGKLYHFNYPFADGSGHVTIATTRPETMLGDTAVAVNPEDERYKALVGKMIKLPLADREIPLIADDYAKMEFGTGAVKVTPAHDLDDFEAGLRNNLPQVVVIGEDGKMTDAAGLGYAGLDRFVARKKVLEDLDKIGLLDKIEDYTVKMPLCDRCRTVLEPLLSEQWFVRMKPLAEPAIDVVKDGTITIYPERYKRIYLDWMENIRDWCISRQLWWGHRIPVWWTENGRYMAARSAEEAAEKLGVPASELNQDEDVLDTWFSSALWPHAVLGWPRETEDLKFWYPTNLLSTAQEILFLWVARMIMTGLDFLGEIPFDKVYIHATVLDAKGDRMSKSKGNGVDPLDLIDQYGADALRFYLLQNAGMNQDIKFRDDGVKLAGQFCNKLWNASRFVLSNLEGAQGLAGSTLNTQHSTLTTADRWILSRLNSTIGHVHLNLASFDMDDAMRAIYHFWWDDFCDWYVELAKPRFREEGAAKETAQQVLAYVLDTMLRLLHPMIPFITEEIWQELTGSSTPILHSPYPQVEPSLNDLEAEEQMNQVMDAVRGFRNMRSELGLPPGQRLAGAITAEKETLSAFQESSKSIAHLAKLSSLRIGDQPTEGKWVSSHISGGEAHLEIGEALDIEKELERLTKEIASIEKDLAASDGRLSNPQYVERAPAPVVEKERASNAALKEKKEKLEARRAILTR